MNLIKRISSKLCRKPSFDKPVILPKLFFRDIPQGYYDIYGYVTSKQDATKRKYIETKEMKEILQNYAHADFYWHYNGK